MSCIDCYLYVLMMVLRRVEDVEIFWFFIVINMMILWLYVYVLKYVFF